MRHTRRQSTSVSAFYLGPYVDNSDDKQADKLHWDPWTTHQNIVTKGTTENMN